MNLTQKIIITDTNIITDLNNAKVLDKFVNLDNVYISDMVLNDEINSKTGNVSIIKNFKVINSTSEELLEMNNLSRQEKKLSAYDLINYVIAKNHNYILATGDNRLKNFSERNNVEVIRTLKIISLMKEKDIISYLSDRMKENKSAWTLSRDLSALNKIFNTGYSDKDLCGIGVKVGADIPFCIVGGTALALDTGSVIAPLPDIEGYHIVIVKPEDGVSTKEAYDAVDSVEYIKHPKNFTMLGYLADSDFHNALKLCSNVFEQAFEVSGRVDIKNICHNNGAVASCMTGSGSAVFGIFKEKEQAVNTVQELKKKFDNVYLCSPEKVGVEILKTE